MQGPTSSPRDEGVVKFRCDWSLAPALPEHLLIDLLLWRDRLHDLALVGAYPDGVGYGNLSIRLDTRGAFAITGTQTGHLRRLSTDHVCAVLDWDVNSNRVECAGPVRASSESLTHATLYALDQTVGAVVHVHSRDLWLAMVGVVPTTSADVPYGTPAMAAEIGRLWMESDLPFSGVLAMAGHEEGVIATGPNLDRAVARLLWWRDRIVQSP